MKVALGYVAGLFGVKGWLRIYSYTRPRSAIFDYSRWWITVADTKGGPTEYEVDLLEGRAQADKLVARISDDSGRALSSRDDAARLVGAKICVARAALPPTPEGVYYWADLIGLQVRTVSGDLLGQVEMLTDNGAHDVLVVSKGKSRQLVPFVLGPIVTKVCTEKGYLVVNWEADY